MPDLLFTPTFSAVFSFIRSARAAIRRLPSPNKESIVMTEVLKFEGTDEQLYRMVAPLVMDPKVLKQNNNFPFRTGKNFTWFVATDGQEVKGFMPVEQKREGWLINNYYVQNHDAAVLSKLLKTVVKAWNKETPLHAVVLVKDQPLFEELHFTPLIVWTRYVKMSYQG